MVQLMVGMTAACSVAQRDDCLGDQMALKYDNMIITEIRLYDEMMIL
jgi:hypothetical protein